MTRIVLLITLCAFHVSVFGHGYILNSRAKLCAQNVNKNCGPVQFEPQSIEGPDRFPTTGPADGTIAGAGNPSWSALNQQSPTRWHKIDMEPGSNTFAWHFTATHVSRDWRYFITKQNWNQNQPLSRASFELTPFCTYPGNGQHPDIDIAHTCNVPVRSGYQVILSVWDVGDTDASFYHVVDVKMPGSLTPPKKNAGHSITPWLFLLINEGEE